MHIEGNVSRVVAFFALLLGAGCSAGGSDFAGEHDGPTEAQLALDQDGECLVSDEVVGPSLRQVSDPSDRFWDVLTWRLADDR